MRRAALAALLFAACRGEAATTPAEPSGVGTLHRGAVRFETPLGPWIVRVEVATSDAERERGLMFRRELPPDHGMIFVFPEAADHGFWMRNTLLSLDMIFLGEDRKVVGVIDRAEPKTETLRTIRKPSRYVVEVAGGEASAHAVGPGTRAVFVDIPE